LHARKPESRADSMMLLLEDKLAIGNESTAGNGFADGEAL
jgi:hypothetical protein